HAVNPSGGHHPVARFQGGDQPLLFLLAPHLWPEKNEIHNDKDQNDGDERSERIGTGTGWRCWLGLSEKDKEHVQISARGSGTHRARPACQSGIPLSTVAPEKQGASAACRSLYLTLTLRNARVVPSGKISPRVSQNEASTERSTRREILHGQRG